MNRSSFVYLSLSRERDTHLLKERLDALRQNTEKGKCFMANQVKIAHADHNLKEVHTSFVSSVVGDLGEGFFIKCVEMPKELPDLKSALYGPSCGDAPVQEDEVYYAVRNGRPGPSRMVNKPLRPCRNIVIVGIKDSDPEKTIVFTAYGTQASHPSPREWWDSGMKPSEAFESAQFWMVHALTEENA